MFKNHPKGLYALALANTGERFGYYTMLAIFVLFLQAKFGFNVDQAGQVYGIFLALVYFMPLVGGILADKFGYGKMVTIGIIIMFVGYLCLAFPVQEKSLALIAMYAALFCIAIGTGLFKGNLQVLVGNLYDAPEHKAKRDNAFSIFYMAINVGAMFAPTAATKVTNYFLAKGGFSYSAQIPSLAHQFLDGTIKPEGAEVLKNLAIEQGAGAMDLGAFSSQYIESLSGAYNYGFGVACISLIISMIIYVVFRNSFKHADYNSKQLAAKQAASGEKVVELTPAQTKSRITALILVFLVVIFFWMSFHQNGSTMTTFARDYTAGYADGFTRIGFDIFNLVLVAIAVYGAFSVFQSESRRSKIISGAIAVVAVAGLIVRYIGMDTVIPILPQIFQQFNPFFVVVLTPFSMSLFSMLAKRGKEPSTPRKIGLGMVIAAFGFLILVCASNGLASPLELEKVGGVSDTLVSPNWLISTYLVLTFAELLLSPMGISFVTKVAPPKYKGAMMGLWFVATAIGNYLTSVIAKIWGSGMQLWMIWSVLVVLCLISAVFMFSMMKRLEKATEDC
ncbi:MFS transporter [Paludibacter sp. 221]|uniref:peptide MFS transporter n=1 Tax=Paludibacter sp. 221 TaxID=2302939 RepID=UPI0013D7930A|nr:peptide MFS transporter [Paludibacter sp. 221]NDV46903.1 MFS transporter [Paludibacter sp. 221]